MEVSIPRRLAPPVRVQAGGRALAASSSLADDGGPDPQRLAPPIRFRAGGCRPAASSSLADGAGVEPAHGLRRGLRFPAAHLANSVSHPPAESGALEAHARGRALVSSEARSLIGSLSSVPHPGFEPGPLPSEGSASASWARRALVGANDGDRTRDLNVGNVARYQLRNVRMEPAGGIDPPTFLLPRGCSAD
jgi:hypothetical protein